MNNKTTAILSALAALAAATLCATPSSNTVEAVTQDWKQGNYSNVYELAQARFASNSNDLVAKGVEDEHDYMLEVEEFAVKKAKEYLHEDWPPATNEEK